MDDFLRELTDFARSHGVRCTQPVVLRDRANLLVHLAPAPVVARVPVVTAVVRPDPARHLVRERQLAVWLRTRGVAVVGPSDLVPDAVHRIGDRVVSFLEFVRHDGHPDLDTATAAQRDLARVMIDYPGSLPPLVESVDDFSAAVAELEEVGSDDDVELARLRDRWAHLDIDAVPLHGDAHARNILLTKRGLVWNDFEDACRGPEVWDRFVAQGALAIPSNEVEAWCVQYRAIQGRVWPRLVERVHARRADEVNDR